MVGLSVTGLLLIGVTLTVILLVFVILQKEPRETADTLDRVLLVGAFSALAVALFWGGLSLLSGVLSGAVDAGLAWSVWTTNVLYTTFIVLGWIKIIRNLYHNARRK